MGFSLVEIVVPVIHKNADSFHILRTFLILQRNFIERKSFPEFNQLREEGGWRVLSLSNSCHT
jgi:hypothetical protein